MKYAGVVVTYNRKRELLENIKRILAQSKPFDNLYIIDNHSSDGTLDFLIDNNIPIDEIVGIDNFKSIKKGDSYFTTRLVVIVLPENIGGAGGFNKGMEKSFIDGNEFIVLMDDDGRPVRTDCFEQLYEAAISLYKTNKLLMINSLVVGSDEDTMLQGKKSEQQLSFGLGNLNTVGQVLNVAENGVVNNLINPFNGTLVSRELLMRIGFVNEAFFIRGDEVDFQSRALEVGAKIATICDSVYFHPACQLIKMRWFGRVVYVGISPPWKCYYLVRNYTYRIKRDQGLISACKFLFFSIYSTIKVDNDWKLCIRMIIKGFKDGIKGHLGKIVKPGEK